MYNTILAVITESFAAAGILGVTPDTLLQNERIDSITFVQIIVDIEEQFNIEFDDEALLVSNYKTVDDLIKYTMRVLVHNSVLGPIGNRQLGIT